MNNKSWLVRVGKLLSSFVLTVVVILTTAGSAAASADIPAFDPWKIAGSMVNFFILLALLYKFGYNPILKMLDERRTTIEGSLRQAEEVQAEVEKMQAESTAQLTAARKEAQEIIARARTLAEETKEGILAQAQEEANQERAMAIAEINNEKEKALAELRDTAATLAIMAAEKVLGKAITVEDHRRMVKDFVNEVGDRIC